jgi:hypothetical protein
LIISSSVRARISKSATSAGVSKSKITMSRETCNLLSITERDVMVLEQDTGLSFKGFRVRSLVKSLRFFFID